MEINLTIKERLEWLKNNPPVDFKVVDFWTWEDTVKMIDQDIHSFMFNHPYYCGPLLYTTEEARHLFLDDFNVPRKLI